MNRPRLGRAAPADPTPAGQATRLTALAVAAAAIACLAAAGGLAPGIVPLAVLAMAVAEIGALSRSSRTSTTLRSIVLPVSLLFCTAPALVSLAAADGDPTLVREAGARLAAGALVVLPLAGAARRDHLARFALAGVTAGLALSTGGSGVLLPAVLFAVAALMLLVLLEADRTRSAESRTAARRSGPGVPRRTTALAAVTPILIAGVLAGLLAPRADLPDPPSLTDSGSGGPNPATAQRTTTGGRLSGTSASMDLRQRGDLPKTEVAWVETDEELLWRSAVLTRYARGSWAALPDARREARTATGVARTDAVTLLAGSNGELLSPGTVRGLDPPQARALGFGNGYRLQRGRYVVNSLVPTPTPTDATPVDASASDPATLALPPLPARVRSLARELTAGAGTRAEAVDAVVGHLRSTYRYRLDSAVPERGEDPVDHFLFEAREGFCEQFASAAAVLLRSVGVPARVAVGYAGGDQVEGGRLLRGTDGHAWVEVEYPEVGWVAVDPTAGSRLSDASSNAVLTWLRAHGTGAALLALGGAATAALVVVGVAVLRRRREELSLDALEKALRRLDRRLGGDRRRPDETLREFAVRVRLDPEQTSAVLVAEDSRYAAVAPPTSRRRSAARALRHAGRSGGAASHQRVP